MECHEMMDNNLTIKILYFNRVETNTEYSLQSQKLSSVKIYEIRDIPILLHRYDEMAKKWSSLKNECLDTINVMIKIINFWLQAHLFAAEMCAR